MQDEWLQSVARVASVWNAAACAFVLVCLATGSAQAQTSPAASLSVDMPHGGCRLTVARDGTASIHFGAMPRSIRVGPGAFSFETLVKDLQGKSYPQNAQRPPGVPVGTVSLPASEELLFIHDEAHVRSLLQRAWTARVIPLTPREIEDYGWVSKACTLR